jgi:hypothetical protein
VPAHRLRRDARKLRGGSDRDPATGRRGGHDGGDST